MEITKSFRLYFCLKKALFSICVLVQACTLVMITAGNLDFPQKQFMTLDTVTNKTDFDDRDGRLDKKFLKMGHSRPLFLYFHLFSEQKFIINVGNFSQ